MKRIINLTAAFLVLSFLTTSLLAQEEIKVQNKKMVKSQTMDGVSNPGPNWVDEDGDGICDNKGTGNLGKQFKGTNGNKGSKGNKKGGLGDGSGLRPQDGTGFGSGNGSGDCDGTGSKGSQQRKGRK